MSCNFFLFFFHFFLSQKQFFESFRWGIIFIDFMGFPSRTPKFKNDINYIKYKFSHRFGKVYKGLNMYYSNIIINFFKKSNNHVHLNHFKKSCMDL